ncbi:MAG: thiamine phosphate synthase [Planctomycetes bacterium]|jgi:thiamine-phosphate pyrophosphorylase|nr:thiamine phosphate synthase [Planctomycetota bacterium]
MIAAVDPSLRILDANLNRAREGLRTAEEYARLGRNAPAPASLLKEARRHIEACVTGLGALAQAMLAARDVAGDVGLRPEADDVTRRGPDDVARAALKRAQEALRVVEEFCQLHSRAAAACAAKARYAAYQAEQALFAPDLRAALAANRVMCVFSDARARPDWREVLARLLDAGARLFQLREKNLPAREFVDYARAFLDIARTRGALVIVNDRADVAAAAGADGVHLGQNDLTPAAARALLGAHALIGLSTHNAHEAAAARAQGADYLGLGSMFPTATKAVQSMAPPQVLADVVRESDVPVFAIGGITPQNVSQVAAAGARHVAVSAGLLNAPDPAAAFRVMHEALGQT